MNKDKLVTKLHSWSPERAQAFLNMPEMPMRRPATNRIIEWEDDGMYLYSGNSSKYFHNNGTIMLLNLHDDTRPTDYDAEAFRVLYQKSLTSSVFNIAELVELSSTDTHEFRHYKSPFNQLGLHFIPAQYQYGVDDKYLIEYIDQLEWFINTLSEAGLLFPKRVEFMNRLHTNCGHYYFDLRGFCESRESFVARRLKFIGRVLENVAERKGIHIKPNCQNPDAILAYAKLKLA